MSFTVYRSSAGSGKTYTLVKEYLKLVLQEPGDFRHILAITFTNKAANEMKERILEALEELSKGDRPGDDRVSGGLLRELARETGLSFPEISASAAATLEMILHNYADFSIGTIDAFSHKLIRTFAHDFGLAANFNVELDSEELLSTAVDLLLDRVGDDKELTALLVDFLETRMEEDRGWDIASTLTKFAKLLLDEEGQSGIRKLKKYSIGNFRSISEKLYKDLRTFEKNIRDIASKAMILITDSHIPLSAFYYGEKGIGRYFQNLANGRMDRLEPNSYVLATIDEDKWYSGKVSTADRAAIDAIKPALVQIYEQIRDESDKHRPLYLLRKLLAKTLYPLAVLNEIGNALDGFKRQNNLVHISEFNARIAGIVMNEPVPFIFERLGEKYRHIFIDEFQDTSAMQWMNYIPLVENALSGGYFNLVVGDGKQAIYRWRNGDVQQFNALPSISGSAENPILRQREQVLTSHFEARNLEKNFRSGAEIVRFNNDFFRSVADLVLVNGMEKIYEGLEQQYDTANSGGYICLEIPDLSQSEMAYDEFNRKRVLEIVREALNDGFRFRDMAVLCRNNSNASKVAAFLLENGIDVLSAESLLVSGSPAVRFIIACLRFLHEPGNDIVTAEISRFLGGPFDGEVPEALKEDRFAALPLYDLCEALMREFNLNTQVDAYLQFFLDAVLKFSSRMPTGVPGFLEWWEKNKDKLSIVVPEGIDAVSVMTIHKSKGLQFPVVILCFAMEKRKNTKEHLWVELDPAIASGLETAILRTDKDLESTLFGDLYREESCRSMVDLLNMLYVAMTRPKERLYIISGKISAGKDTPDSWPGFFDHYLKSKGLWREDRQVYEFGKRTGYMKKQHKQNVEVVQLNNLITCDWNKKILIKTRAPRVWDNNGQPAGKPGWGNLVHTVLSWIRTGNDVGMALDKATMEGLMDRQERKELERIISQIINDNRLARLFSGEVTVRTEAEILLPGGTFYRPDRVVFDGDLVTVIDYKSGKPGDEHREQLKRYAGYLEEMGYQNIQRLLVYTGNEITVEEVG